MKKLKVLCLGILSLIIFAACGQNETVREDKLSVVATNSILADLIKEVGGNKIALHSIVPVGIDPHEYEPLPEDIKKVSQGDVVFYNGLNLETGNGWFDKLMETADKVENQDYFAASRKVEAIYLQDSDQADPHAWLDISNGILYIEEITLILSQKDPDNQSYYQKNAKKYIKKLTMLDEKAKTAFSDIPDNQKLLVTSEGAFKYFSRAYGLTASYIWEINTESQGTPDQLKKIVETVEASSVPVLFVETSVDQRSMEKLANEVDLPIYSKLFTDSIGKAGKTGDSYYKMMKWNLEKIHEGLRTNNTSSSN